MSVVMLHAQSKVYMTKEFSTIFSESIRKSVKEVSSISIRRNTSTA